jgi:hypothetical protein
VFLDHSNPSILKFQATGLVDGYVDTEAVAVQANDSPWPMNAYTTIPNYPSFGPVDSFCYRVSAYILA